MDVPSSANAIIINIAEHTVFLELAPVLPDGKPQRLEWPKSLMPAGLGKGDAVTVQALSEGQLEAQSQRQARVLLGELLGSQP
jgi:hypothetical protein